MDDLTLSRESIMCAQFAANIMRAYKDDQKFRDELDKRFECMGSFLFETMFFFEMSDNFVEAWYAENEAEDEIDP